MEAYGNLDLWLVFSASLSIHCITWSATMCYSYSNHQVRRSLTHTKRRKSAYIVSFWHFRAILYRKSGCTIRRKHIGHLLIYICSRNECIRREETDRRNSSYQNNLSNITETKKNMYSRSVDSLMGVYFWIYCLREQVFAIAPPPLRTPGFKSRIRPPYPQRVVKGD